MWIDIGHVLATNLGQRRVDVEIECVQDVLVGKFAKVGLIPAVEVEARDTVRLGRAWAGQRQRWIGKGKGGHGRRIELSSPYARWDLYARKARQQA